MLCCTTIVANEELHVDLQQGHYGEDEPGRIDSDEPTVYLELKFASESTGDPPRPSTAPSRSRWLSTRPRPSLRGGHERRGGRGEHAFSEAGVGCRIRHARRSSQVRHSRSSATLPRRRSRPGTASYMGATAWRVVGGHVQNAIGGRDQSVGSASSAKSGCGSRRRSAVLLQGPPRRSRDWGESGTCPTSEGQRPWMRDESLSTRYPEQVAGAKLRSPSREVVLARANDR